MYPTKDYLQILFDNAGVTISIQPLSQNGQQKSRIELPGDRLKKKAFCCCNRYRKNRAFDEDDYADIRIT